MILSIPLKLEGSGIGMIMSLHHHINLILIHQWSKLCTKHHTIGIGMVVTTAVNILMEYRNTPRVISIIVVVALAIQMICAFINVWWKISTHTAAIGGVAGALVSYSVAFNFNPLWWLCLVLMMAGAVGSARMILRQHTLSQVVAGFLIGTACAILVI